MTRPSRFPPQRYSLHLWGGLALLLLYVLAFSHLYAASGRGAAALSAIWLFLLGWAGGPAAGLLWGVVNIPLHLALYLGVEISPHEQLAHILSPGFIIGVLTGWAAGQMRQVMEAYRLKERALRFLGRLGSLTAKAASEEELLRMVPGLATEVGKYRCSILWRAYPDGRLEPVAWASLGDCLQVREGQFEVVREGKVLGRVALRELRWDQGSLAASQAVREGRAVVQPDVTRIPGYPMNELARILRYRAVLGAPIRVDGQIWGALVVAAAEPRAFADEETSLLEEAARGVGMALERLKLRLTLEELAVGDALTGLLNRHGFLERASTMLEAASAEGRPAMLLFLDLNRFKEVNDTLGHAAGDRLLTEAAQRLQGVVGGQDLLGRVGGDEFALLLYGATESTVLQVARQVREVLQRPFEQAQQVFTLDASLGVARFPQDGLELSELLRKADIAMYQAKRSGDGLCFFDASSDRVLHERLELERGLRRALVEGEVQLHYQPVVSLHTGAAAFFETLARWRIPPSVFVPLAEEVGLSWELDRYILSRALAQLAAWEHKGHPVTLSVNLSPRSLTEAALPDFLQAELRRHGLSPQRLILEITEGAVVSQEGKAALSRLKGTGVILALDDFGTGYSSLEQLKALPVDLIKVARPFVKDAGHGTKDAAVVRAVFTLAQEMGLLAVAEGVESENQRDLLEHIGYRLLQGYLFSKPLPPEKALSWNLPVPSEHS